MVMPSMFLSQIELIELTNRVRSRAQISALHFMDITHRVRPDGSVAVLRSHVQQALGGSSEKRSITGQETESQPNWNAI